MFTLTGSGVKFHQSVMRSMDAVIEFIRCIHCRTWHVDFTCPKCGVTVALYTLAGLYDECRGLGGDYQDEMSGEVVTCETKDCDWRGEIEDFLGGSVNSERYRVVADVD
jgi:hypothetical protein